MKAIKELVEEINTSTGNDPEKLAASYAVNAAKRAGYGMSKTNLDRHLINLSNAGAEFELFNALQRALKGEKNMKTFDLNNTVVNNKSGNEAMFIDEYNRTTDGKRMFKVRTFKNLGREQHWVADHCDHFINDEKIETPEQKREEKKEEPLHYGEFGGEEISGKPELETSKVDMDAGVAWAQIETGVKMSCGARNAVSGSTFLMFEVGRRTARYIRKIAITLSVCDEYTVELLKIDRKKFETEIVQTCGGVYAENLSRVVLGLGDR